MRALAVSLCLLVLIITVVIINAVYMASAIEDMKQLALEVVEGESEAIDKLTRAWDRHKVLMGLSTSFCEIDSATEQLLTLRTAYELGNQPVMRQSYALFCNALDDIGRYEKMSVDNIF